MFVSRKCLAAFIHLFARELSYPAFTVAQLMHRGRDTPGRETAGPQSLSAVPKELMQRGVRGSALPLEPARCRTCPALTK